jgi:hypothetical protein
MSSILDPMLKVAKILVVGESGVGKSGAQAALVAAGYQLRIIDTDKGVKILRTLLTDERYPYAKIIKSKNIDLNAAVRFVPIDTAMGLRNIENQIGDKVTKEKLLAPKHAKAWAQVIELLDNWREGDVNYGPVNTWDDNCVLTIDTLATLAKAAYYYSQALNNRLGARDVGYSYQADVGGAQSQIIRLLEYLYDSDITCNVIVMSHITWVDTSQGVPSRPKVSTADDEGIEPPQADGYATSIGRAIAPFIGKYFNDVYSIDMEGTGVNVRRKIQTLPKHGIKSKASVYLDREYDVSSGLAEIFAAQRGEAPPTDLIEALKPKPIQRPPRDPRDLRGPRPTYNRATSTLPSRSAPAEPTIPTPDTTTTESLDPKETNTNGQS